MNTLSTRILGLVMDYRNMTGTTPRFILLGHEEYAELRSMPDPSRYIMHASDSTTIKETFMGVEVLNVNRVHFLDIAT